MKEVVAVREKKKVRTKASAIGIGVLSAIAIIYGLVCVINPMNESNMPTIGGVLIGIGVLLSLTIILIIKAGKRIAKVNTYPEQAVVIEDENLYILTDKLTKIPLKDIKRVSGMNEVVTGVFVRVIKTTGNLTIKTQDKKYRLTQIAHINETVNLIKSYVKKFHK